jgi:transglutaminase-like putative cysteine protease
MQDLPTAAHLASTDLIDSAHPALAAFAHQAAGAEAASPRERAVRLYSAVRDGLRYDPYRIDLSAAGMRASHALAIGHGWCVTKSALLAAAARAIGIPARVGYADVRNHLSTERMRRELQTDLFIWHGYTEMWLDGVWVKSTPAFNVQLCERFGLLPLEWDGRSDSLYHAYDRQGQRHMEYVNQRGSFDDVPLARIVADFAAVYPAWKPQASRDADFDRDVLQESP